MFVDVRVEPRYYSYRLSGLLKRAGKTTKPLGVFHDVEETFQVSEAVWDFGRIAQPLG